MTNAANFAARDRRQRANHAFRPDAPERAAVLAAVKAEPFGCLRQP
jgi:hypothetical protein